MHTKLPNIKSYKNSFFCYLIFEEIEKKFLNQGFSHFLHRQGWSKSLFDFSKSYPSGYQVFFFKWFQSERKCLSGWVHYKQWSLILSRIPLFKNLKTSFFFALTLWSWNLFPFLKISAKFIMTKGVQNKSIHFMQMLTSKQSLYFSRNAFTNENIRKQKMKRLPLVDPLS